MLKFFNKSNKEIFFDTWYGVKYNHWHVKIHFKSERNKNDKCSICGIEGTWPINIVEFFTLANWTDDNFEPLVYCYNHKDELPDDLVDCWTGIELQLPEPDRLHKAKYYCKKFGLDIYISIKFVLLLIKNIFMWRIVLPLYYWKNET